MIFLVVPAYFDRYRGRTTATVMLGNAVGTMVMPSVVEFLIGYFTFKGGIIIVGAILLINCVASMFFRPLQKPQIHKNHNSLSLPGKSVNHSSDSKETLSQNTLTIIIKSTVMHLKQIKHLKLAILTISFSCFMCAYINFIGQIPFVMVGLGYETEDASRLLSISAIGNILVRSLVSIVSDSKWFDRKACYIMGCFITGVSAIGK